jgi:hypothetical protein
LRRLIEVFITIIAIQFLTLNTVSANEAFEAANKEVVFFDGTILTIPAASSEKQETLHLLVHKVVRK